MADRHVDYMRLDAVERARTNPKAHASADIKRSIDHLSFGEPLLLDERTGRIVAGHGRLDACSELHRDGRRTPDGIKVDDSDGMWLIPVTRGWSSRNDEEANAYLIASNHLTTKGGWDDRELLEMLGDLDDAGMLELTGFTEDDLAKMIAELDEGEDLPGGSGDADQAPDVPKTATTRPGDLWMLGAHRLLCGDATNPEHLDMVTGGAPVGIVYTDPPYGISIVKGNKGGGDKPFGSIGGRRIVPTTEYLPVAGDDTADTAADAFRLLTATYPEARHIWWGGNHYAASAQLPDSACWLVWDKENTGNFADAELAWTNHAGAVRLHRHMWNGMLRASERGRRVHPTQKPVALAEWAFDAVKADADAAVLDVFGGSGSTLMAAHRTGRTAYVIEMEPLYCDVICRRYQEATGTAPTRDGVPYDFVAGEADVA